MHNSSCLLLLLSFLVQVFFPLLVDRSSLKSRSLSTIDSEESEGFSFQVLQGCANTMDWLVKNLPLLGLFCGILCWKVKEDLDHILWRCKLFRAMWGYSIRRLGSCMLDIGLLMI